MILNFQNQKEKIMDESHRLEEIKIDYSQKSFKRIYNKVLPLKKSIAGSINPRRLGVSKSDIESFIDIKITYVFNKYHNDFLEDGVLNEEKMKAHILKAMSLYKTRLFRMIKQSKYDLADQMVQVDDIYNYGPAIEIEENENVDDDFIREIKEFMHYKLSEDAYRLFMAKLETPIWVIDRMEELGKNNIDKIPSYVWAEYFEFEDSKYISKLNKEIEEIRKEVEKEFNY